MSAEYRYGFYLRPDLFTSMAVSEIHRVLRKQYGLFSADLFMPHATIKGFYRSDASVEEQIARYDAAFAGFKPFTAYNNGTIKMGSAGIVTSWRDLPDGSVNRAFRESSDRAWQAIEPLIHPDCDFRWRDPRGDQFHPHITLAMADVLPKFKDEIYDFVCSRGKVGSAHFVADTYQLFRFRANWQGNWWHTLTWEHLHSWQMKA